MLDITMLWSTLQDMTTTEPIDRLTEDEFPYDEVAQLEEFDELERLVWRRRLACCASIPCRFGACEVN